MKKKKTVVEGGYSLLKNKLLVFKRKVSPKLSIFIPEGEKRMENNTEVTEDKFKLPFKLKGKRKEDVFLSKL